MRRIFGNLAEEYAGPSLSSKPALGYSVLLYDEQGISPTIIDMPFME